MKPIERKYFYASKRYVTAIFDRVEVINLVTPEDRIEFVTQLDCLTYTWIPVYLTVNTLFKVCQIVKMS